MIPYIYIYIYIYINLILPMVIRIDLLLELPYC